jgi:hypothetical protein
MQIPRLKMILFEKFKKNQNPSVKPRDSYQKIGVELVILG